MRTFSNSSVQIGTLPISMLFQYHYHDLWTSLKPKPKPEAVARWCSVKKCFTILQNSQKNTCVRVSFFYQKKTPTKEFSCEFCQIFKNTLPRFIEHLQWLLLLKCFYYTIYLFLQSKDILVRGNDINCWKWNWKKTYWLNHRCFVYCVKP